jgi:beta-glucanase (GH16 family)
LQSDFHIYRMEFSKNVSPQQIHWYVDGNQRFSVSSNQVDATTWMSATNHGFFIILNVAIGGGWAGNPTISTASGGTMKVDYVRVYMRPAQVNFLPLVARGP